MNESLKAAILMVAVLPVLAAIMPHHAAAQAAKDCDVSSLPPPAGRLVTLLVDGRYREVAQGNDDIFISPADERQDLVAGMATLYPEGFTRCDVIKSAGTTDRINTGITVLTGATPRQMVFLKTSAFRANGQWWIGHYLLTSRYAEIVDAWE